MGHYSIDYAAVAAVPGLPSVDGKMRECADDIYDDSQALVPVDTGELKASGYVEGGASEYKIGYTADHAAYVEFGTGPHLIEGNPTLAFSGAGGMVFASEVHHPGTDPQPYLLPAATRQRGVL